MSKKRYAHSVNMSDGLAGNKRVTRGKDPGRGSDAGKKELREVYNRYFKDQAAALYKAVTRSL